MGVPDTPKNHKSLRFILHLELERVKATLSIKIPVRQHRSEWYSMAAVRPMNGPSILPRNLASLMPRHLGLE